MKLSFRSLTCFGLMTTLKDSEMQSSSELVTNSFCVCVDVCIEEKAALPLLSNAESLARLSFYAAVEPHLVSAVKRFVCKLYLAFSMG